MSVNQWKHKTGFKFITRSQIENGEKVRRVWRVQ